MEGATLAAYYRDELFPFDLIYRMMTCNRKDYNAEARTIAVQFSGDSNVYVMHDYKRDTCLALKQKILFSSSKLPQSLHMAHFKSGNDKMVRSEKELVFDLDITDFTRYCSCHGVKRLCSICWPIMQGASLILNHLLENSLGYAQRHLLWVFSGRKGVHCLVNEPKVMSLSDNEREQLHKRLSIPYGDDQRMITFIRSLSQHHTEFVERMETFFVECLLGEHDIFSLPKVEDDSFELSCLRYLRLRHISLYYLVKSAWDEISLSPSPTKKARLSLPVNISLRKWKILQSLEKGMAYKPSLFFVFRFFYPMIDKGPLKLNHQIKLPFSVHCQTQNIALPLSLSDIMQMNITTGPLRVTDLCKNKKQPPVPSYNEGYRLLERWVETYNDEDDSIY